MPSTFTSSFIGFFAALTLYAGVITGVIFYLASQQEWIERYTSKKDNFMDIVLVARPKETPKSAPKAPKEQPKKEVVKTEPQEIKAPAVKPAQPKPAQQANVRDLFGKIDTSKLDKPADIPTPKPREQSRLKPEDSPSQPKQLQQNKASSLVAGMELESVAQEQSSTGIYDEYRGKINELLDGYWNETPGTVAGAEGTVEISIDTFGNFSYSIESLSYNNTFNAKLRDFLERMRGVSFPPSPESNGMKMKINFKDELEL